MTDHMIWQQNPANLINYQPAQVASNGDFQSFNSQDKFHSGESGGNFRLVQQIVGQS